MTVPPPTAVASTPDDFLLPVRKSPGVSSRRSLDLVARNLRRRDLGHAGTLDPFAVGLLLILGGRATRLVPWIQCWDKEYVGRIRLGVATDSLDATGAVVAMAAVPSLTSAALSEAASGLTGTLLQPPPMYSAAQVGGQRLYELARRGLEVERTPRERQVAEFEILSAELPDVVVRVVCSSGTYIRVLAESFGQAVGLPAHLATLERTRIGPWRLERAISDEAAASNPVEELLPWFVSPADILADWPSVRAPDPVAAAVRNGRLPADWALAELPGDRRIRLLSQQGGLLALVEQIDGSPARLLRVFESASDGSNVAASGRRRDMGSR